MLFRRYLDVYNWYAPGSMNRLFRDFFRKFAGVIIGGVRHYLGGTWGSFWTYLGVNLEGFRGENLPKTYPKPPLKPLNRLFLNSLFSDQGVVGLTTLFGFSMVAWLASLHLASRQAKPACVYPLKNLRTNISLQIATEHGGEVSNMSFARVTYRLGQTDRRTDRNLLEPIRNLLETY